MIKTSIFVVLASVLFGRSLVAQTVSQVSVSCSPATVPSGGTSTCSASCTISGVTGACPTSQTPTLLKAVSTGTTAFATTQVVSGLNVPAGSAMAIFAGSGAGSPPVYSVSDTAGNTFACIPPNADPSVDVGYSGWCYGVGLKGSASDTVTWKSNQNQNYNHLNLLVYSGVATTLPVDASAPNGSSVSGNKCSGSVTTTQPNDIVLFGCNPYTGNTFTAGPGATVETNDPTGASAVEDMLVSSVLSSQTVSMGYAGDTSPWIGDVLALKAAPGGISWTSTAGSISANGVLTAPVVTSDTSVGVTATVAGVAGSAIVTVTGTAPPPPSALGISMSAPVSIGGATIQVGSGAPTGSCALVCLYLRTDGGSGSTLYVWEAGTWKAK